MHPLHPLCSWESRFGIKAFQHPDLVEILTEMTHENRLMELLDIIVIPENGSWKGSQEDLELALFGDSIYKDQVKKLLYYPTALQTYLRRLHKSLPERVKWSKSGGKSKWELQ